MALDDGFLQGDHIFMAMQKVVIPGLTWNLGFCASVEFTGFRIKSGMTEMKDPDFLQRHHI